MSTAASSNRSAPGAEAAPASESGAGPAPPGTRLRDWPLVGAKALVVGVWTIGLAGLLLVSWLPTLARPRWTTAWRARTRRRAFRIWARGMTRTIGVRVVTKGEPPPAGVLVVSNHLSYLDIAVLGSVVPMVFVSKAEVRRWPLWGFAAALGGTVFVDRTKKRDVIPVLAEMQRALDRGDSVIVFPEATSTEGATILPFKPALLAAAAVSENPVHWVTLSYRTPQGSPPARDRVCWWGDIGFVPHAVGLFALKRVYCTVRFGDAPVRSGDRKALAVALRRAMLRHFEPVGGEGSGDVPG